jgi:subtilisin family serine protease
MRGTRFLAVPALASTLALSNAANAGGPDGATLVRLLGPHAQQAFAPGSTGIGALVRLPAGMRAADVGLTQVAPGFARLWGLPATIVAFADAHPGLPVEVAPPLRLLLDTATTSVTSSIANTSGNDGTGVLVGIADTGIDVTHPDFLDESGATRVAWLLDLSSPPRGVHPDLEQQYGVTDGNGNVIAGAVWDSMDIDAMLQSGSTSGLPQDEVGHGTLVSACAASNGLQGRSFLHGVAPKATLLVARITSPGSEDISNDNLLLGAGFLFGLATTMGKPIVVNLSLGTDFGPHDGTMAWEQTLATYVGPGQPGRALVAAAGNSGSIADNPVHQNVHVNPSTEMRVPLTTQGAQDGGVQVWVAMHAGAELRVGLDAPTGTWISPVDPGQSAGKNESAYSAAVYNGSAPSGSPVPSGSNGAVVIWQGQWPPGTYEVTLSGTGTADLYLQGTGDAAGGSVGFANGVREGTINLPATNPSIIGVGCTINKVGWTSLHGAPLGLDMPVLDAVGGMPEDAMPVLPTAGQPCWFSSAGPTLTGLQKPEIMAPGAAIAGAMSHQAIPPVATSIFTNPQCPSPDGGTDPDCQQLDDEHAVSFGTSFAAPLVAGAIAILLQSDPSLTQDELLAALQGGAHPLRGPAPFEDQAGVGEVDVVGALTAAGRLRNPVVALPDASESWLSLGADELLADGSTPMQAIVQLRASRTGSTAPPPADGFDQGRLVAYGAVDGLPYDGAIASFVRRGPGVWVATVQLPAGLGGSTLTVGVTFDGNDIVAARTIPIATDAWNAEYPPSAKGGCVVSGTRPRDVVVGLCFVGLLVALGIRRARR